MKKVLMGMMAFLCCAGTAFAQLAFVQAPVQAAEYDLVIANGNLVVTVPAGVATGKTLIVTWDEVDCGKLLKDWTNRQVLAPSIPAEGICFSCPLEDAVEEGAKALRAFTADELVVLERLQMANNKCYIDTGVIDSTCSRVAFSFYQTGQTGAWGGVIGTSGEDSFAVGMNNTAATSWCWWYGTLGKRSNRPNVYTDRPNVVDFNEGVFNLNGSAFDSNLGVPVGRKNRSIYVGTSTIIPGRMAYGWWYYVRMWDMAGEPLIDYVPARRTLDGAVGFYDRVSGNLIQSSAGGAFTAGAETEGREYLTDVESSPVFLDENMIQRAVWTGAGDRANLSDAANWTCTNFYGEEVPNAVPQNGITSVTIAGMVAFSCPTGAVLPWKTATFGSCTLAGNADWAGLGTYPAWLSAGATIDLAGYALTVVVPAGREAPAATFTSSAATTAELHLVVTEGYAALPELVLTGNLKLVKEGVGAFYLSRTMFTGGDTVAAGVLGASSLNVATGTAPTFELVPETGVVRMSVPPGWRTGEALFLVSDASKKGGDPFAWAVRHLVVSALPSTGAIFEFEPASLGLTAERPLYLLTASELGMMDRLKMTNTGTWIDTGIQDKQCTRVEFAFYQDGGCATESPGWGGGHIGTLDENSFAMSMSNGHADIWCWWYKGAKKGNRPTVSTTSPNVVDFNNGTFFCNGTQIEANLGTPVGTTGARLYVGRGSGGGRYDFGWWYYVRLWNGGTKLIDYVPIRRESDGRACFYDRVSQRQIFSSGGGEFTAGSTVTNRFYVSGQVFEVPYSLETATAQTAIWIGAGDAADLMDPQNWECRNLYGAVIAGAVPNRTYTQATVQNETNFECGPDATEPWLALHVNAGTLTRDHDWRGAKALRIDGTVDLNGKTLAVSALTGTGKVAGTGTLRMDVPKGVTAVNSSLEVGGAVHLVKEGEGTYQPKVAQTYTGGTRIAAGTLALPISGGTQATYSPQSGLALLGPMGSTIMVDTGATFDGAGNYDLYRYNTILNGGTYASYGVNQDNYASWGCNGNITLTTNSFMRLTGDMALTSGVVDLGGWTLTVDIATTCHFHLIGGEIKNGKMIATSSSQTGMFCVYKNEILAPTVDLDVNCRTEIKQPFTVHDYTMRRDSPWGWSASFTKVTGRFLPLTDHFPNVELQTGAILDLTTKTGVWSNRSLDINNGGNTGGAFPYGCVFADEATIVVDVSGRRFTGGEQVAKFETEVANLETLKFKLDKKSRERYSLRATEDGLFVILANTIIYIR